jgi:hypothetical protein
MHPPPRRPWSADSLTAEKFYRKDNHTKDKYKEADPVNPVHIPDPLILGTIRVFFPDKKIFRYLPEYAHAPGF